jgi:hypothetical protein
MSFYMMTATNKRYSYSRVTVIRIDVHLVRENMPTCPRLPWRAAGCPLTSRTCPTPAPASPPHSLSAAWRYVKPAPTPFHTAPPCCLKGATVTTPPPPFLPRSNRARHSPFPPLHLIQRRHQRIATAPDFSPERCSHLPHLVSHAPAPP